MNTFLMYCIQCGRCTNTERALTTWRAKQNGERVTSTHKVTFFYRKKHLKPKTVRMEPGNMEGRVFQAEGTV